MGSVLLTICQWDRQNRPESGVLSGASNNGFVVSDDPGVVRLAVLLRLKRSGLARRRQKQATVPSPDPVYAATAKCREMQRNESSVVGFNFVEEQQ
jgi:hypothetical protein